jgi:hypothetical protein
MAAPATKTIPTRMSTVGDKRPPSRRSRCINRRHAVITHHRASRAAGMTAQVMIQSGQSKVRSIRARMPPMRKASGRRAATATRTPRSTSTPRATPAVVVRFGSFIAFAAEATALRRTDSIGSEAYLTRLFHCPNPPALRPARGESTRARHPLGTYQEGWRGPPVVRPSVSPPT